MEMIVVLLVAGAALLVLEPFFPHFVAGPVGLAAWVVAVLLTRLCSKLTRFGSMK